jgi:hypothetical protein
MNATHITPNEMDSLTAEAISFAPLNPAALHSLRTVGIIMLLVNTFIVVAVYKWGKPAAERRSRTDDDDEMAIVDPTVPVDNMLSAGRAQAQKMNDALLRDFAGEDLKPAATDMIHSKRESNAA